MINVKVFSDFGCPFCYIATGIVDKLKEEGIPLDVEWIPYEIHPDVPIEGETLYKNFPKEQVDKMFLMLNRIGKPYEIQYGDVDIIVNTKRALLAGEYAKTVGKYDEFSQEIFKAIFLDVKNVGEEEVLNQIAQNAGLAVNEMNKLIDLGKFDDNIKRAKQLGTIHNIEEVPTFVIKDKIKVGNVRNYNRIKKAILEAE